MAQPIRSARNQPSGKVLGVLRLVEDDTASLRIVRLAGKEGYIVPIIPYWQGARGEADF